MLQHVTIEGYRLFRRLSVDFSGAGMLVLIGPNGAGKSTLLEALDLMARSAASEGGLAEAIALRGGLEELSTWNTKQPLRIVGRFPAVGEFEDDGEGVEYELVIGEQEGFPAPTFERIDVLKGQGRKMTVAQRGSAGTWALNVKTKERDSISVGRQVSIVAGVTGLDIYPTLRHLRNWLRELRIYSHLQTAPRYLASSLSERFEGARSPAAHIAPDRLDSRAINLQTVLLALKSSNLPAWKRVVMDFRLAFPAAEELDFKLVGGQMGLAVRFAGDSQLRPATSAFSDGMFTWLAVLAALATAPKGSLVAFDEPEASLHPEVLRLLVGQMEVHSQSVGPVVLCTHADRLLDYLHNPAGAVRVLDAPTVRGGSSETMLQRLNEAELDEWRGQYSLSQLRVRGLLDKATS